MKRKLINEIRRLKRLAGIINEMRVGPDGSLMSDEEAVNRAIEGSTGSLAKILKALKRDPQYARARQALDLWIKSVSEKLNIGPDSVPRHHQAFSGEYSYGEALPMIKQIFVDMISGGDSDEEQLAEDDYTEDPSTIPSGDTDPMSIGEADDLDLSDTPGFKPKLIKPGDIPDGWEEVEGDPGEDGYLLFFQLRNGTYEPLSGLGYVFVSISNSPSGTGFEVDVRHNENPPSIHFFKTFQEAWIFARSEMIDIVREIDDEDYQDDDRYPY